MSNSVHAVFCIRQGDPSPRRSPPPFFRGRCPFATEANGRRVAPLRALTVSLSPFFRDQFDAMLPCKGRPIVLFFSFLVASFLLNPDTIRSIPPANPDHFPAAMGFFSGTWNDLLFFPWPESAAGEAPTPAPQLFSLTSIMFLEAQIAPFLSLNRFLSFSCDETWPFPFCL